MTTEKIVVNALKAVHTSSIKHSNTVIAGSRRKNFLLAKTRSCSVISLAKFAASMSASSTTSLPDRTTAPKAKSCPRSPSRFSWNSTQKNHDISEKVKQRRAKHTWKLTWPFIDEVTSKLFLISFNTGSIFTYGSASSRDAKAIAKPCLAHCIKQFICSQFIAVFSTEATFLKLELPSSLTKKMFISSNSCKKYHNVTSSPRTRTKCY